MAQHRLCGFGSVIAQQTHMPKTQNEESDLPFIANDWNGRPGTMGNALDTADAPGKADSEMGEGEERSVPPAGQDSNK